MRWLIRLTPRLGFLWLGLGAWGLVVASLVMTEWWNLNPCPLCIFQRVLYMLFGLVAIAGALPRLSARGNKILGVKLALIALGGFLTAAYQSLMQARPDLVIECSYTNPGPIERFVDWLATITQSSLFMPTGLCSSQEWVFLGLSMANWSLVCFLGLGIAALWIAFRSIRRNGWAA
ncbi:MAG: disulfide bond formation protein B [Zoogloeaceae bacterium]|jgi:disulfide bond formation protein DsbB|nr:disulfide bond formation protein B [Zoogloeaceae bacterium]